MISAIKFIMTLIGLLLIGLNIASVLLLTQCEGVLRAGITRQARQVLQAEVRLERVRLDWSLRALEFRGVSVHNPEGFTDREAIWVESIRVRPDFLTLFARAPVMRQVTLQGGRIQLQHSPERGTNLGAITASAAAWADQQNRGETLVLGRRMRFQELVCETVEIQTRDGDNAGQPPISVTLPGFALPLPESEGGMSGAQAIHAMLQAVAGQITGLSGLSAFVAESSALVEPPLAPEAGTVPAPAP